MLRRSWFLTSCRHASAPNLIRRLSASEPLRALECVLLSPRCAYGSTATRRVRRGRLEAATRAAIGTHDHAEAGAAPGGSDTTQDFRNGGVPALCRSPRRRLRDIVH